jgi:hypothetical protein
MEREGPPMKSLWDRLDLDGEAARLRGAGGLTVAEAVSLFENGSAAVAPGPEALDWVAVLAFAALGDPGEGLGPPLVQRSSPRPGLKASLTEPSLASLLPGADRGARLALLAGLLQIHDFWEPSHDAAQDAEDAGESRFSAYWHGIAHRREPDAGNALYWFRRVGRHPLFDELGRAARGLLEGLGEHALAARLVGPGGWNPGAMVDLCVGASAGNGRERIARRLQRLEMQLLLNDTAAAVAGR